MFNHIMEKKNMKITKAWREMTFQCRNHHPCFFLPSVVSLVYWFYLSRGQSAHNIPVFFYEFRAISFKTYDWPFVPNSTSLNMKWSPKRKKILSLCFLRIQLSLEKRISNYKFWFSINFLITLRSSKCAFNFWFLSCASLNLIK